MSGPTIKVKVVRKPSLKLKLLSKFPSSVSASSPLTLDRTGGNFAFGLSVTDLRVTFDSIYAPVGIAPGGTSGQVQINSSGVFAGITSAQLTAKVNSFTSSLSGAVPASGGGTTNFLRADGTFASPVGVGVTSVTVGGTTITTNGTLPAVAYDAAQSLTIPQKVQAQSNANLSAVYRRPMLPWLKKWGAAKLNVLQGTSNAKLLILGDSTAIGAGQSNPLYPTAWPTVLASLLTAGGLNSSAQSRFSDGALGGSLAAADPRVVMGASYTVTGVPTLGGNCFDNGGTISTPWKFTPSVSVTHFDFYSLTTPGIGSLKIDINGGSATTLNENAANAVVKTTISTTLGSNTLNVTPVSATAYFIGVIGYNSAVKEVSVINAGVSGAFAATFNVNVSAWNAIGAIGALAPDLTIIDLTINDAIAGTALSTYVTNLKAAATAAASGDIIFIGGAPIQTSSATLAAQLAVNAAMSAAAASVGANYISFFDLWQSRTAIIAAGYDAGDGVHLTTSGYAAMAAQIAPHLL